MENKAAETEAQRIEREIAEYNARVPRIPDALGVL
jgi:hypothetical protein